MREIFLPLLLALLLSHSGPALAVPNCAATLAELHLLLGEADFPLAWQETSMDDGKPLLVSILETDGALMLEFVKTGQGLWAQSAGLICRSAGGFEIRFSAEQIRMGPAAGWALGLALGNGGVFTLTQLAPERLRITTTGWSGTFVPKAR